jgi:hypothetical protein
MNQILDVIDEYEIGFHQFQKPLIMQPIWKTAGQNPNLADNAFDIFVWSDYAFTRLFLDASRVIQHGRIRRVSRQMRSSLRFARCLYEISRSRIVNLNDIYSEMAFGYQTDKEFSVNGRITNRYMGCDRLETPILPKEVVYDLILNGGEELLRPERRFDQTIFFTMSRGS